MGSLMKNGIATYSSLAHEYFVLQINGRVNSTHRSYTDGCAECNGRDTDQTVESPKNWATIFRAVGFPECIFDRSGVLVLDRSGSRNAFDLAAVEAAVAAAVAAA